MYYYIRKALIVILLSVFLIFIALPFSRYTIHIKSLPINDENCSPFLEECGFKKDINKIKDIAILNIKLPFTKLHFDICVDNKVEITDESIFDNIKDESLKKYWIDNVKSIKPIFQFSNESLNLTASSSSNVCIKNLSSERILNLELISSIHSQYYINEENLINYGGSSSDFPNIFMLRNIIKTNNSSIYLRLNLFTLFKVFIFVFISVWLSYPKLSNLTKRVREFLTSQI